MVFKYNRRKLYFRKGLDFTVIYFSASGCPHANRNKSRSMEGSLSMGQAGLLKYGGLIKAGIPPAAVPYSTHTGMKF